MFVKNYLCFKLQMWYNIKRNMQNIETTHIIDPSTLTTQQLWREIAALKELLETKIRAIETAVEVAHSDLVRVPTDVQKQVGNLKELHAEKFISLSKQLDDRQSLTDRRNEERFVAGEKAVNAALIAAKEAVLKAETSADKRFESVNEFRQTLSDQTKTFISRVESEAKLESFNNRLSDTVARLDKLEGRSIGMNAGWAYIVGAVGLAATIISIILVFNN